MDTLPLPPHPSLEQYKKRAKDLVKAANSPDPEAVRAWASDWLADLASRLGVTVTPFVQHSFDRAVEDIDARVRKQAKASGAGSAFKLADAQWLIARAHSFETWAAFVRHLEGGASRDPRDHEFEAGADAIVSGDLATLESLAQTESVADSRAVRAHSPIDASALRRGQRHRGFSTEDTAQRRRRSRAICSTPAPRSTRCQIPMAATGTRRR